MSAEPIIFSTTGAASSDRANDVPASFGAPRRANGAKSSNADKKRVADAPTVAAAAAAEGIRDVDRLCLEALMVHARIPSSISLLYRSAKDIAFRAALQRLFATNPSAASPSDVRMRIADVRAYITEFKASLSRFSIDDIVSNPNDLALLVETDEDKEAVMRSDKDSIRDLEELLNAPEWTAESSSSNSASSLSPVVNEEIAKRGLMVIADSVITDIFKAIESLLVAICTPATRNLRLVLAMVERESQGEKQKEEEEKEDEEAYLSKLERAKLRRLSGLLAEYTYLIDQMPSLHRSTRLGKAALVSLGGIVASIQDLLAPMASDAVKYVLDQARELIAFARLDGYTSNHWLLRAADRFENLSPLLRERVRVESFIATGQVAKGVPPPASQVSLVESIAKNARTKTQSPIRDDDNSNNNNARARALAPLVSESALGGSDLADTYYANAFDRESTRGRHTWKTLLAPLLPQCTRAAAVQTLSGTDDEGLVLLALLTSHAAKADNDSSSSAPTAADASIWSGLTSVYEQIFEPAERAELIAQLPDPSDSLAIANIDQRLSYKRAVFKSKMQEAIRPLALYHPKLLLKEANALTRAPTAIATPSKFPLAYTDDVIRTAASMRETLVRGELIPDVGAAVQSSATTAAAGQRVLKAIRPLLNAAAIVIPINTKNKDKNKKEEENEKSTTEPQTESSPSPSSSSFTATAGLFGKSQGEEEDLDDLVMDIGAFNTSTGFLSWATTKENAIGFLADIGVNIRGAGSAPDELLPLPGALSDVHTLFDNQNTSPAGPNIRPSNISGWVTAIRNLVADRARGASVREFVVESAVKARALIRWVFTGPVNASPKDVRMVASALVELELLIMQAIVQYARSGTIWGLASKSRALNLFNGTFFAKVSRWFTFWHFFTNILGEYNGLFLPETYATSAKTMENEASKVDAAWVLVSQPGVYVNDNMVDNTLANQVITENLLFEPRVIAETSQSGDGTIGNKVYNLVSDYFSGTRGEAAAAAAANDALSTFRNDFNKAAEVIVKKAASTGTSQLFVSNEDDDAAGMSGVFECKFDATTKSLTFLSWTWNNLPPFIVKSDQIGRFQHAIRALTQGPASMPWIIATQEFISKRMQDIAEFARDSLGKIDQMPGLARTMSLLTPFAPYTIYFPAFLLTAIGRTLYFKVKKPPGAVNPVQPYAAASWLDQMTLWMVGTRPAVDIYPTGWQAPSRAAAARARGHGRLQPALLPDNINATPSSVLNLIDATAMPAHLLVDTLKGLKSPTGVFGGFFAFFALAAAGIFLSCVVRFANALFLNAGINEASSVIASVATDAAKVAAESAGKALGPLAQTFVGRLAAPVVTLGFTVSAGYTIGAIFPLLLAVFLSIGSSVAVQGVGSLSGRLTTVRYTDSVAKTSLLSLRLVLKNSPGPAAPSPDTDWKLVYNNNIRPLFSAGYHLFRADPSSHSMLLWLRIFHRITNSAYTRIKGSDDPAAAALLLQSPAYGIDPQYGVEIRRVVTGSAGSHRFDYLSAEDWVPNAALPQQGNAAFQRALPNALLERGAFIQNVYDALFAVRPVADYEDALRALLHALIENAAYSLSKLADVTVTATEIDGVYDHGEWQGTANHLRFLLKRVGFDKVEPAQARAEAMKAVEDALAAL
jgi:hypothetical protein